MSSIRFALALVAVGVVALAAVALRTTVFRESSTQASTVARVTPVTQLSTVPLSMWRKAGLIIRPVTGTPPVTLADAENLGLGSVAGEGPQVLEAELVEIRTVAPPHRPSRLAWVISLQRGVRYDFSTQIRRIEATFFVDVIDAHTGKRLYAFDQPR